MNRMNGKELANAFSDAVNSSNFDCEEFATYFARQHRSLQQSMMRAMLTCVDKAASADYGTDGRNEGTATRCRNIRNGWLREASEILQDNHGWDAEKSDKEVQNYKLSQLGHI